MLEAGSNTNPAIVFLHGWGASKEIWLPTLHNSLVDHFHLIALDMPGVGDNDGIQTDGSPQRLAESIAKSLDSKGITKYAIVGHSQGANVGAWLAQSHPERVTHLIHVNPALYSNRLTASGHYLNPVYGTQLLTFLRSVAGIAGQFERTLPAVSHLEIGWSRGYLRRLGCVHQYNSVEELKRQLHGLIKNPVNIANLKPDLPILIIHGALDATIPLVHSKEAVESRPINTKLIVYDNTLHCPMDTHPAQFARDIEQFLKFPLHSAGEG
jgi:pimeloyl-ACP methyl ester carboxylesterase